MKIVRNLLLVIIALLLQTTLVEAISIHQIKPDVVIIVLVFISFYEGKITGTIFGFSAGWLQDIYAPEYLGLNALCKSLAGFFVGCTSGGVIEENIIAQGIILFFATFIHDVLYFLIYSWGDMHDYVWYIVRYGLPTALYTTAVGLILFALYVTRRKGRVIYAKRFIPR